MSVQALTPMDSGNSVPEQLVVFSSFIRGTLQEFRKKPMPRILLLTLLLVVASFENLNAQPPEGSQLPPDENTCATCHGEADLWEGETLRLYVPEDSLADDVHWKNGVNCHDCHGGDPSILDIQAHGVDDPEEEATEEEDEEESVIGFRANLDEVRQVCGNCHKDQRTALRMGVHHKAGEKDERGAGTIMTCGKCHGEKVHGMLPTADTRAPMFLDNQIETCGECHEEYLDTYKKSVHGLGLFESGLVVTASCSDCHGAHGIFYAADKRSTLHRTNVAKTCGECHRFIEERLRKSVHGQAGPGELADKVASGGKERRTPSCTSCHQGHALRDPKSAVFRLRLPDRCGNCHWDLSKHYAASMHGELTALGYGPAAKCSDCHGAHDILPISDPESRLSSAQRMKTCKACHLYATTNFLDFDPHADHTDPEKNPLLYWVYVTLMTLLISTFGFFGVHSILWFMRSLVNVLRHGRPRPLVPGTTAYERFGVFHRVSHLFMLVAFLGLALTGLPLKYSGYGWAKTLAYYLGGFESTGFWHRVFALVTLGCFVAYLVRMSLRLLGGRKNGGSLRNMLFGPDSLLPTLRDVKEFFAMLGWFFGLRPKPTFERWAYWEKFDFWGAAADIVIIGFTGFVLWFPNLFCRFLPGETLNIAKVIHSTQALLATGFVFAIHFFNTHLRAEKFPADLSILTGLVSEEELREERPDFFERMRQEGKLDQMRRTVPSRKHLRLVMLGGTLALGVGLSLLAGMVLASLGG